MDQPTSTGAALHYRALERLYEAAPVNKLFDTVFGLERSLIGRVPMPFGVSLVAVLRRPR